MMAVLAAPQPLPDNAPSNPVPSAPNQPQDNPQDKAAAPALQAYIGINVVPLPPVALAHLSCAANAPCIQYVVPNSPAEQAGLRPYDIILKIDGLSISYERLDRYISLTAPEHVLGLTILRNGQPVEIQLKPQWRPITHEQAPPPAADEKINMPRKDLDALLNRLKEQEETIRKLFAIIRNQELNERIRMAPQLFFEVRDDLCILRCHWLPEKQEVSYSFSKKDTVIYCGPLNSEEEHRKLPEDLRQRALSMKEYGLRTLLQGPKVQMPSTK